MSMYLSKLYSSEGIYTYNIVFTDWFEKYILHKK